MEEDFVMAVSEIVPCGGYIAIQCETRHPGANRRFFRSHHKDHIDRDIEKDKRWVNEEGHFV